MSLPADSHVHTQFSWDAPNGDMLATCARAIEVGLPAVAFTEHVDHTVLQVSREGLDPDHFLLQLRESDGTVTPPAFDATGYLAAVADCRERFPQLRILSGLELGEPHRHVEQVAALLGAGDSDRVLGSLHTLPHADGYAEPPGLYTHRAPGEVLRSYLAEVAALVSGTDVFEVLAHVDYPVRSWPQVRGPFEPSEFEAEFRHTLGVTASSGRVLEINTVVPFHALLLRWWREEGGAAVTFGSDAHEPNDVARGFRDAVQLAEACGFRPGPRPYDVWGRS
ncbi:PHP domain-containing protein [Nocardioides sp.]|uniref:PHP domain-containing protein n=1 Tax=Nocardioides sp. TaxID=35761 RepID=UPI002B26FAFB|nr:PHP domain-containing protein [Nocardioides sp.]